MTKKYGFNKEERLSSKKAISDLFENGNTLFLFPYRLLWLESKDTIPSPVELAISVPKKNFRKAVHRNRIKRLIREAWRLNKHSLYEKLEQGRHSFRIMLIYTHTEMPEYKHILKKTEELISKLLLILPDDSK